MEHHRRSRLGMLVGRGLLLATALAVGWSSTTVAQDEPAPEPADVEQALADRFAPIIMIKQQEERCDAEGEPYAPTRIDIVLDNPEVVLRQLGEGNPVLQIAPSASDLYGLNEGFFVDFPGSALDPGCIYEQDFEKYAAQIPATVYAHVVQQPDVPDRVFVQYWFYWYFNDWNNKHESDWEGITLEFEASSIDEALRTQPVAVGYSQHEGGERADWDDEKLEREGDRPIVYSSAGSHASYFDSGVYLGRSGSEGFGCDETTGPSERLSPDVVVLPDAVDGPDDPNAWLAFEGRWGERQNGPFNGPTGPAAKDRWLEPAPWFEELRSSSVVIPAGGSGGAVGVIDVFCGAVEGGSGLLIRLTTSPVATLLGLAIVALIIRFVARRTDWSFVGTEPVIERRRAGQIIRAAVRTYAGSPTVYILFGLVYIPAAVLTGLLMAIVSVLPLISPLLSLAGTTSGTSLILTALVGSIANVLAFIVVNAIVAEYLDGHQRGFDAALDAVRSTWRHRRDLFGAFIRSFVIVFLLLASFVGIPWGIRQLVRYQFIAQAVTYDDRSGQAALDRSSRMVRGRWLHTAIVAAALNGFVALVALIVALLLLVVATGIPIWVFSALTGLVYALTVPLAAIAMTLLYGDAIAEKEGIAGVDDGEPATVGAG